MLRSQLAFLLLIGLFAPITAQSQSDSVAEVSLELVAEGFNAPIFLTAPPDGSGRRFLGEQMGLVYILESDGKPIKVPFLDLRDQLTPLLEAFDERGLLALGRILVQTTGRDVDLQFHQLGGPALDCAHQGSWKPVLWSPTPPRGGPKWRWFTESRSRRILKTGPV